MEGNQTRAERKAAAEKRKMEREVAKMEREAAKNAKIETKKIEVRDVVLRAETREEAIESVKKLNVKKVVIPRFMDNGRRIFSFVFLGVEVTSEV